MEQKALDRLVGKLYNGRLAALIYGAGAREYALRKMCFEAGCMCVYMAPGNGAVPDAERVRLEADPKEPHRALLEFARAHVDLVIVGPEAPLVGSIVDQAHVINVPIVGPVAAAAALEGSKVFTTRLAQENGIPIPESWVPETSAEARDIINKHGAFVVKADGLAAGKGVEVCDNPVQACAAVVRLMDEKKLGTAGQRVELQKRLIGEEMSSFWLCDGATVKHLGTARDYKLRYDKDHQGPNRQTGGMGSESPCTDETDELVAKIEHRIVRPALDGLNKKTGVDYQGVLYVGLMLVRMGGILEPFLIEFNVRFGDPEGQVLIPRFEPVGLLHNLMATTVPGALRDAPPLRVLPGREAAFGLVLVRREYPDTASGEASVIGDLNGSRRSNFFVFPAGVERDNEKGQLRATGGRVMTLVNFAPTVEEAKHNLLRQQFLFPTFSGMDYRHFT